VNVYSRSSGPQTQISRRIRLRFGGRTHIALDLHRKIGPRIPSKSMIVPVIFPSCCEPCASQSIQHSERQDCGKRVRLRSISPCPFSFFVEERRPWFTGRFRPIISYIAGFKRRNIISRPARTSGRYAMGVANTRLRKRAETQQATVARSASQVLAPIARPRQLKWRTQLQAAPNNLALFQANHRRYDFDPRLRPGPPANQLLNAS